MNGQRCQLFRKGGLIAFALLCLVIFWLSYQAGFVDERETALSVPQKASQEDSEVFQALLQDAELAMAEEDYSTALSKYAQIEAQLEQHGFEKIQEDLLYNQALAYSKLSKYGEAIARLEQLSIKAPSDEIELRIMLLRSALEYKVYLTAPDTAFVRGSSIAYELWSSKYSYAQLKDKQLMLCLWLIFCAAVLPSILRLRLGAWTWILRFVQVSALLALLASVSFYWLQRQLEDRRFAVITESKQIFKEPSFSASPELDPSITEGNTVEILEQNAQWMLVKRSDGLRFWMPQRALYELKANF